MAYGQEPVMMMAEGGVARYQAGGGAQSLTGDIPGFVAGTSIFQTQPRPAEDEPLFRRWAREFGESTEAKRVQEARVRAMKGQPLSAADQERIKKADSAAASDVTAAQDMAQFDAASNLYMTERAAKQAAAKPKPAAPAAAKADTGRKVSGPGAPAARPAAPAQSDVARFMALQKAMGVDGGQGLETAQKDLSAAVVEAAESNERELEKEIAARGKAGEGREARLNKREAGMGAQKKELQGLALLEAGLAIMSTPGKLAEAVGKGAQAGLKTYSAGVKDLRAAQEKLDEARDQLEELRRNEDNMTAKERREARQGVKAAQVKGKELGLQAAEKMYGYKRADASAIFTVESQGVLTDKEIQGRKDVAAMQERGANARAARTPAEIQMVERIMAEKKIPFSEALNYMTAAKREPVSQEKLRADWLDPTKRMQIAQDYPNVKTFDDYALVMGAGTGGGAGGFKLVGVR